MCLLTAKETRFHTPFEYFILLNQERRPWVDSILSSCLCGVKSVIIEFAEDEDDCWTRSNWIRFHPGSDRDEGN